MRCYIKEYTMPVLGIPPKSLFNRTYQNEHWSFTGRIKYQRNEYGRVEVSFEVFMIGDGYKEPRWYESKDFDFDDSTMAVVIECDTKYGI